MPTLPTGKIEIKDKKRFLSSITTYEKLLSSTTTQSLYYKQHLIEDILLQISSEHVGLTVLDNAKINDRILNCVTTYLENNLKLQKS